MCYPLFKKKSIVSPNLLYCWTNLSHCLGEIRILLQTIVKDEMPARIMDDLMEKV